MEQISSVIRNIFFNMGISPQSGRGKTLRISFLGMFILSRIIMIAFSAIKSNKDNLRSLVNWLRAC